VNSIATADVIKQKSPKRNVTAALVHSVLLVGYMLKKKIKKADNKNIIAPNKRSILNPLGKSPILRAAIHKAARVPGAAAFLIGFIRLSNSSGIRKFPV